VFNNNPSYPLNVRKAFLVISALAIIWVYIYKRKKGRHWVEALLAASILGLSWETAYHLRFIASDGILMQFGVLVTLFCLLAVRSPERSRFWLLLAAISAGLATSTKYPAGLFLLPVLLASYQSWDRKRFWHSLAPQALGLLVVFGISYLIITPGTILDPFTFFDDIREAVVVYGSGHGMHTVTSNWDYLWRAFVYLFAVFPSHYIVIAVFFSLFTMIGIRSMWKESHSDAVLFLIFPAAYLAFFSFQSVFFVRNFLLLFPFLAILSARGIAAVYQSLSASRMRFALAALVIAMLAINANWVAYTSDTIRDRGSDRYILELQEYLEEHPETNFIVSDRVLKDLNDLDLGSLPNVSTTFDSSITALAVYFYESMDRPGFWPVNFPGLAPEWFGPIEINMDYYASWQADDRILIMDLEKARELDILLIREE
ncbi:MAG: phospholipid carrier-dependent glycosyltransferase, partial [Anaerolineae bacterium]|nr:phospholipid carrier-dependent glycosyltransferase [Anaerolineae bacterium]